MRANGRCDRAAPALLPEVDRIGLFAAEDIQYLLYIILMERVMQVSKWGNSLAVRLPASVVEALELKEGDDIEIQIAGRGAFEIARKPGTRELLATLRKFRGRMPEDFRFDRLQANERG